MKERIIFGANSTIAEGVARLWARRGDHIVLVGRNGEKLAALAKDLQQRGASKIEVTLMNFDKPETLQKEVNEFISDRSRLDTVLIAQAIAAPTEEKSSLAELEKLCQLNFLSVAAILLAVKPHFLRHRHGTLAAFSCYDARWTSGKSYFYGATKAALDCFLEGLRDELKGKDVHVCTIMPGPVAASPLTAQLGRASQRPVRPELVATQIVQHLEKRDVIYAPASWRWYLLIKEFFPSWGERLKAKLFKKAAH